jgi:hypothetical protein
VCEPEYGENNLTCPSDCPIECASENESCFDIDCCSGLICSNGICVVDSCVAINGDCTQNSDCCSQKCFLGKCKPSNYCSIENEDCVSDNDCCFGLYCNNNNKCIPKTENNSIKTFELVIKNNNVYVKNSCLFNTQPNLKLFFNNENVKEISINCNNNISETIIGDLKDFNNGLHEGLLTINEPCDTCQKSVFMFLSKDEETFFINDNIPIIFLFLFACFIVFSKRKKTK